MCHKIPSWDHLYFCYTGCPRRNVKYFGRVFLMLNYTHITQNTYIQSWTVTEIMAREVWNWQLLHTCWLPNTYWNWQEYVVSVMLISVLNIKVTCEWQKVLNWTTKTLPLMPQLSLGFQALYIALAYLAAMK